MQQVCTSTKIFDSLLWESISLTHHVNEPLDLVCLYFVRVFCQNACDPKVPRLYRYLPTEMSGFGNKAGVRDRLPSCLNDLTRFFFEMHKNGNNANIGSRGFTT